MARKKQQTYNEMVTEMGDMRQKIDAARDHIADVLASQMDYATARTLGDLTDRELRLVADLMFLHSRLFRDLALHGAKPQQLQDEEDGSMVEGELRHNIKEHCWEVWDAGKKVGALRDGMCVELSNGTDNTVLMFLSSNIASKYIVPPGTFLSVIAQVPTLNWF